MMILIWGLVFFVLAFILHILFWRVRLPSGQATALLFHFSVVLFLGLAVLLVLSASFSVKGLPLPSKALDYLHIALLYFSLASAYIATYPAIEVDSPSLVIVKNIAAAGRQGLAKEEFKRIISDDLLVKPRIDDLVSDKLVYLRGNTYVLTGKGSFVAGLFHWFRGILNAPKGG